MGYFIANKVIKLMIQKNLNITKAKVLILGITFKENCTDIRNSKVVDIYNELKDFGLLVDVYDPNASSKEVKHEYGITLINKLNKYSAIILAVSHKEFLNLNFRKLKISSKSVIYDIKSVLDRKLIDGRL
jgi:UDP-N-acetyl-D-galactosamine dehydrogenase